ncbi:MAG: hypothetical protein HC811_01275 [Flammeovirgaceae bacterium]|nr:hypothetical protein [Flammeovirgaceae bacterium]
MNDTLYSTLSFADRKRKTLLLQLSVVVFIVTITYAVIDISMNIHVPPAVYIMFLALSLVTNWLTRRNHVHLTKILSLSFFNLFYTIGG